MSKLWELKQSATPKTLDLYIYSDIESDGYDWWTGEKITSETSANTMLEKINGFGELDNINIYINSLGGSCLEGHAIYNILKRCKATKIVYIDGFCCSVASIIAMAGDKIIMPKNTVMIIHNPWTRAIGNAAELRKQADDLDVLSTAYMTVYEDRAGGKLGHDELKAMLDAETTLTAEDCIRYGLADEYAVYNADLEAAKAQIEQSAKQNPNQYAAVLRNLAARIDKLPAQNATPPTPVTPEPASAEPTPEPKQEFAATAEAMLKKYFKIKGD